MVKQARLLQRSKVVLGIKVEELTFVHSIFPTRNRIRILALVDRLSKREIFRRSLRLTPCGSTR